METAVAVVAAARLAVSWAEGPTAAGLEEHLATEGWPESAAAVAMQAAQDASARVAAGARAAVAAADAARCPERARHRQSAAAGRPSMTGGSLPKTCDGQRARARLQS